MTREGVIPLSSKALNQGVWPTDRDVMLTWFTTTSEEDGFKPADGPVSKLLLMKSSRTCRFYCRTRYGCHGPLMGVILRKLGNGADGKSICNLSRIDFQQLTNS